MKRLFQLLMLGLVAADCCGLSPAPAETFAVWQSRGVALPSNWRPDSIEQLAPAVEAVLEKAPPEDLRSLMSGITFSAKPDVAMALHQRISNDAKAVIAAALLHPYQADRLPPEKVFLIRLELQEHLLKRSIPEEKAAVLFDSMGVLEPDPIAIANALQMFETMPASKLPARFRSNVHRALSANVPEVKAKRDTLSVSREQLVNAVDAYVAKQAVQPAVSRKNLVRLRQLARAVKSRLKSETYTLSDVQLDNAGRTAVYTQVAPDGKVTTRSASWGTGLGGSVGAVDVDLYNEANRVPSQR